MDETKLTFEKLPQAVSQLIEEVSELKRILLNQNSENSSKTPIDVDQVSQLLMRSKTTIYHYVQNNHIPCYRNGRKLYFYKEEILTWLNQGKQKTNLQIMRNLEI